MAPAKGTAAAMIAEAISHDGTLETPTNHTEFGREFGWDGVAWCHIFLSVCARRSGCGEMIPWTAGCWTGVDWFRDRGQFFRRGAKTPRAGDIVYYGASGGDHVGLVTAVHDGRIYTCEGNTSRGDGYNPSGGGVHRKSWPLTNSRIYGYGRPAYKSAATEEDDMPNLYVSLGSTWSRTVKAGADTVYLGWDREYADATHEHGNTGVYPTVLMTPSRYVATVGVAVDGLPAGGSGWIRFVEVADTKNKAGEFPIKEADPLHTVHGLADGGRVHVSLTNADTIGKGRRLRVQMGGFTHDVVVRPATIKIHGWKV
ncbi:hypothetical protein BKA00_007436 [Actinomadura coerulea]|uniref:Peptidase C51 domain-containing protein n=1 Tax=Actinomadura coerulea TaxID=46159 RepID=A0A7X0G8A6_9ACTN|nr:hypothetical protein [Actinomadura coerulea]GGQ07823.1 hypothetical protein GCM10010187_24890 [Actinomadura coerulea]